MSARSQRHAASDEGLDLLSSLSDSLAPGVLVVSQGEQIISLSPEAEHLLGLRPHNSLNPSLELLPVPLQRLVREVLSRGKVVTLSDLAVLHDGRYQRKLRITALPLPAPSGPQVLVILNDITGFLQLEQTIGRLDRLATIGTLSASMAHEIKNALVAVKAVGDALRAEGREDLL